jgi:CIC family chloride channel protein
MRVSINYYKHLPRLALQAIEWAIVGVVVGVAVGLLMVAFRTVLVRAALLLWDYRIGWGVVIVPTLGFLCVGVITTFVPMAAGRGADLAVGQILRGTDISLRTIPAKFLATVLTLASGGSGGREGPALQMAAAVGDWIARHLRFRTIPRQYIVISAVSASFGAMFHAPTAGALFGCEVLYLRNIRYGALLACLLSSLCAYLVSVAFYPEMLMQIPLDVCHYALEVKHLPLFVLFGLVLGLVGPGYIGLFRALEHGFHSVHCPVWLRTALGGVTAGLTVLLVQQLIEREFSVAGGSLITLEIVLSRSEVLPILTLLILLGGKTVATFLTVGSGASAGLVAPSMFCGAVLGAVCGQAIGIDPSAFAVTGMLAFFATVAHVPLAMAFMAAETFHTGYTLPVAVAGLVGSWVAQRQSLFPSVEELDADISTL